MNTKQAKKIVKKSVKKVEKKGGELKDAAKIGYDKFKKEMQISPEQAKALEAKALKEYAKIKKQMEVTSKKIESYARKNPEKVAMVSAGIGMALGAVAGILATHGKSTGKKKR